MAAVLGERETASPFMSVREVAAYLQLNEKKIYALLKEGKILGTKVTGKWLFPRELIDRWLLDSAHGGILTDRLLISGSDDPLLYRAVLALARQTRAHALVSYSANGTRLGLELLQANRIDLCAIHWGTEEEAHLRHAALLRQYSRHHEWVLVRAFRREQGILLSPRLGMSDSSPESLLESCADGRLRWVMRQAGAGAQRFLLDRLERTGIPLRQEENTPVAHSERDAAAFIAMGRGDLAPGIRAAATEFGLDFVPLGWEAFDLALPRGIYFRRLFQQLLTTLHDGQTRHLAGLLGGYDLTPCGNLVWSDD